MKILWKALFVVNIVLFVYSWALFGYIGPEGLASFLLFMVSGGYVILFLYANWDYLIKK